MRAFPVLPLSDQRVRRGLLRTLLPALVLAAAVQAPSAEAPDATSRAIRNAPGLDVEVGRGAFSLGEIRPEGGDAKVPPLVVRLSARWADLEPSAGAYDWSALDTCVKTASDAGARIIIEIHGGHPAYTAGADAPSPGDQAAVEAWTAMLRAVALRYGDRIDAYQIGRRPDESGADPVAAAKDYAFLFKRSAVAVRSGAPEAKVATGTIAPTSTDFASALYDEEISAYTDALSVSFDGSDADRAGLSTMRGLLLARDPSAQLWVNGVQVLLGLEGYGRILRTFMAAMGGDASLVTFADPPDSEGKPFHLGLLENLRGIFSTGYSPLVESGPGVKVLTTSGEPLPGARVSRFFDADSKTVLMFYDGGPAATKGEFAVFVLDSVDIAEPGLHDLAAGESAPNIALQKDEASGLTRAALPLAGYPLVLSYRRFTTPEYAREGERLNVTGERIPSADEIIAKYQAVQEAQDALLKNVRAEATEEWHFTTGATGSFDLRFEESYFFDPNVGAEWEQREVYANGVRWRTNRIPELPFLLPEKAASLPLVVSLSKEYQYEYDGRENVDGFDCYVISFKPVDETKLLSKGKVWIDTKTFERVRIAQAQKNQPAPIISNDQRDTYAPVTGPDGFTYWILSRINSEQIYSIGGRNFVITKSVRLRDFQINGSDFGEKRTAALASTHTMLRDTNEGMRYLQRHADGTRTVKTEPNTMNLFVLGGVLANRSLPFPVPLAGINWFEADLGHKGLQSNVFFAGAFLFANLSDPKLFGSPFEANADLVGLAVAGTDRLVRENPTTDHFTERSEEEITRKTQRLTLGLGLPFWKFFKLKGEGRLEYVDYGRTKDTCDAFVSPKDTWVRSGILSAEFERHAWGLELNHEWAWRSRNEPWGLDAADPNAGCVSAAVRQLPPDFSESAKTYVRYGGTIAKNIYLPHNQKILFRLSGQGSRDLDRFSKYGVSFFDNRIRGFSGGGIHYTNGGLFRADYAFSVGKVVRFGGGVDFARLKDRQQREPFRNYTGAGISAQFAAPWNLLVRLEYGVAVQSDIPEFQGDQEILLTVLKLFAQR